MVRIRLRRQGAKKKPSYRVVVADSRSPRDGRFIENIGFYDPRTNPPTVQIDSERALYWLGKGAQPSDTVLRLLRTTGIWQQFKGTEVAPAAEVEAAPAPTETAVEAKARRKQAKEKVAEAAGEETDEPEPTATEAIEPADVSPEA
jgi:small subunit ribosomal protein S16